MKKGCVHVYVGKDCENLKTAQGMILRACGAGFVVGFYGYGRCADEMKSLEGRLPKFQILEDISQQDISKYNMIVLDCHDAAAQADLRRFLAGRPHNTEVVLYGASFSDDVLEISDLISEIRPI